MEQYIPGSEINVAIWGADKPEAGTQRRFLQNRKSRGPFLPCNGKENCTARAGDSTMIMMRATNSEDSLDILRIASREPLFSEEEIACIAELLQDYYQREDHNDYHFLTVLIDDTVAGFACYGPTPLAEGTSDL
jgi:hypothetical protein